MWVVTVEIQPRLPHETVAPALLISWCCDEDTHLLCVCTPSVVEPPPVAELGAPCHMRKGNPPMTAPLMLLAPAAGAARV